SFSRLSDATDKPPGACHRGGNSADGYWSIGRSSIGLAAFLTQTAISTNALLGFDAYMLIDALCFSMLRHSHIGFSFYGLERFLLSPKQHHLHHSINQKHWDKNFGFMFAF